MSKVLSSREKLILYATIGVILFALLFNFLLLPVISYNDRLNKQIYAAKVKLAKYLTILSQKDALQAKFQSFGKVNVGEEKQDSVVVALTEIETIAKNASIRIMDIRPEGSFGNSPRYKEVLIELRTEGQIEGYTKFIYDIENSLALLKIRKLQISAKLGSGALEGTFSISKLSLE